MALLSVKMITTVSKSALTFAPWSVKQQMCLNFILLGKTSVLYRLIYRWNYIALSLVKMTETEDKSPTYLGTLGYATTIVNNMNIFNVNIVM
jgi:hypothetical protein